MTGIELLAFLFLFGGVLIIVAAISSVLLEEIHGKHRKSITATYSYTPQRANPQLGASGTSTKSVVTYTGADTGDDTGDDAGEDGTGSSITVSGVSMGMGGGWNTNHAYPVNAHTHYI